ncbi:t-SNARE complex subunit (syntaxin) [Clostridium beijerinckii]|nr:DUF4044 domain-containing protein [Clostridium beijerinckii]MBA9016637.1 t-SNARE complex subunit (syntaxin) [Clostridium beijerinckii]NRT26856.1 t-SNARE complex subunit (syntaxin) [Clostridium beijerinckii]NRU01919.1 t-SNARE complex subunit (syntaxin) [Clostridium beijerinckii]NRU83510.1 t-SNARE complex subunit (syntaxin) [Clostridium beijerinckii]NRZ77346.1 t-SNARE complex subunit (syntaxin) [Clostridium beijerinckii]
MKKKTREKMIIAITIFIVVIFIVTLLPSIFSF